VYLSVCLLASLVYVCDSFPSLALDSMEYSPQRATRLFFGRVSIRIYVYLFQEHVDLTSHSSLFLHIFPYFRSRHIINFYHDVQESLFARLLHHGYGL
jgi:hypothetical protein